MKREPAYSAEPADKQKFTEGFNRFYSKFAFAYDLGVKLMPIWKTWIKQAIPHIVGPKVLEVSFGTGYLLTQYAHRFDTYGIDYNGEMVSMTKKNLIKKGIHADIQQGNVESLPYEDGLFDTIVNTMAFSGYPDGIKAMSEMHRVLRKSGRLIIVDVDYPRDRNLFGMVLTRFWANAGDIIRDMEDLFAHFNFSFSDTEIGGGGSVHLFVAEKR